MDSEVFHSNKHIKTVIWKSNITILAHVNDVDELDLSFQLDHYVNTDMKTSRN